MTLVEFGNAIRYIREEILLMTQKELAKELNYTQSLLSRVEKGKGAKVDFVLEIVSFFQKKGVKSHMIFHEPFNIENLTSDKKQQMMNEIDTLVNLIKDL